MCVECGTALNVSNSPVADQERAFIREQIAAGKDKAQIKAALVDEYGAGVLAEPEAERLRPRRLDRARSSLVAAGRGRRRRRARGAGARHAGAEPDAAAAARARAPRTRAAWTRSWQPSTGERRRRHHGHRRVRGRLRLVHLALRAAARARLPVGGLRRLARRDAARRARPVAMLLPGDRLLPVVHGRVRRARHDRDRPRLDAAATPAARSTRSPAR